MWSKDRSVVKAKTAGCAGLLVAGSSDRESEADASTVLRSVQAWVLGSRPHAKEKAKSSRLETTLRWKRRNRLVKRRKGKVEFSEE